MTDLPADIVGTVVSGRGHSSTWVPRQNWGGIGYRPYPGTLNIRTPDADRLSDGVEVVERKTRWDTGAAQRKVGIYVPCEMNGIAVHARAYRSHVEIISAVHLRSTLGLSDGDTVTLTLS